MPRSVESTFTVTVSVAASEATTIPAVPSDTAVTSPSSETVATSESLEPHSTAAPAISCSFASYARADNRVVSPIAESRMSCGDALSRVAICSTRTAAEPAAAPDVAVTDASPFESAVTVPASTPATAGSLTVQVTDAFGRTAPSRLRTVAARVSVSPRDVKTTEVGATSTVAGGGGGGGEGGGGTAGGGGAGGCGVVSGPAGEPPQYQARLTQNSNDAPPTDGAFHVGAGLRRRTRAHRFECCRDSCIADGPCGFPCVVAI